MYALCCQGDERDGGERREENIKKWVLLWKDLKGYMNIRKMRSCKKEGYVILRMRTHGGLRMCKNDGVYENVGLVSAKYNYEGDLEFRLCYLRIEKHEVNIGDSS